MWTKSIARDIPMKTDCWLSEIIDNPPDLNLVYTLKKYQPYADDFPDEHFKFLGVSSYERQENNDFIVPDNKPLIYISLGTVVKGRNKFFNKCFEALKDSNVNVINNENIQSKVKEMQKEMQNCPGIREILRNRC